MRKISPAYKDLNKPPITLPPPPSQPMQRTSGTGWAPAQGWIDTHLKLEKEGWDWLRRGGGGRSFISSEEYWASACHGSCPAIQLQTPTKEEKEAQFLTNLAERWVVDT